MLINYPSYFGKFYFPTIVTRQPVIQGKFNTPDLTTRTSTAAFEARFLYKKTTLASVSFKFSTGRDDQRGPRVCRCGGVRNAAVYWTPQGCWQCVPQAGYGNRRMVIKKPNLSHDTLMRGGMIPLSSYRRC